MFSYGSPFNYVQRRTRPVSLHTQKIWMNVVKDLQRHIKNYIWFLEVCLVSRRRTSAFASWNKAPNRIHTDFKNTRQLTKLNLTVYWRYGSQTNTGLLEQLLFLFNHVPTVDWRYSRECKYLVYLFNIIVILCVFCVNVAYIIRRICLVPMFVG